MKQDIETHRVEAFSDGIFAIAITLLVLEIKIPENHAVAKGGLARSLIDIWPSYLAFIISFSTILVIWTHHHWLFSVIRRVDHRLIYWNGLLLFFVTFVPFPTGVLAEYLLHPEARVAASLYTGTLLAIAVAFHGLWWHASSDEKILAMHPLGPEALNVSRISNHYRYAPVFYAVSFALSFVSEAAGITSCLLTAAYFAVGGWPSGGSPK